MMFDLIVAYDEKRGIGHDGTIPWDCPVDLKYFKRITSTVEDEDKANLVIMGRKTWESIPRKHRPLVDRVNVIISRTMVNPNIENVIICRSMDQVVQFVNLNKKNIEKAFIIGGSSIYQQFLDQNFVKTLYVSKISGQYHCDVFFPLIKGRFNLRTQQKNNGVVFAIYDYINKDEVLYLNLMKNILMHGEQRDDRTNTGTYSLFGNQLKFDLRDGRFPLMTTKFISFKNICEELLWFVSGTTDVSLLQEKGIKIWDGNSSKDFLEGRGLKYEEGDIGPGYGHQWRHYNAEYKTCKDFYNGFGVDQLKNVIKMIKENPKSRRILVNAWNPCQLDDMALPPCHIMFQFYISGKDMDEISCHMYQRSADTFLGLAYNIASYSLLTYMIGHITEKKPKELIISIGDTHVYKNHKDQVMLQAKRKTYPFPKLKITRDIKDIDDFKRSDFKVINYTFHPSIKANMAI